MASHQGMRSAEALSQDFILGSLHMGACLACPLLPQGGTSHFQRWLAGLPLLAMVGMRQTLKHYSIVSSVV